MRFEIGKVLRPLFRKYRFWKVSFLLGLFLELVLLIRIYDLSLINFKIPSNIGIKLVIIFPTLLFLVGSSFKAFITRRNLRDMDKLLRGIGESLKIDEEAYWNRQFNDFIFALMVDSVFLFVANGLIITFQIGQAEIGVSMLIIGLILSMSSLVGIYSNFKNLEHAGNFAVFGLLFLELWAFMLYDVVTETKAFCSVMFPLFVSGGGVGVFICELAFPEEVEDEEE